MKRAKVILVWVLVLTFITGAFAACSKNNGNNEAVKQTTSEKTASKESETEQTVVKEDNQFKEHYEISIAHWDIEKALKSATNDAVYQQLCKKFNITIKPINLTWDDYQNKVQIWTASGQLPDVFSSDAVEANTQAYRSWISQGVVRALPEDMNKYPDLAKFLSTPDIEALKVDGKLYCVPRVCYSNTDMWAGDRAVIYRSDWLKNLGITKEPETFDEFAAMLKAFAEKDPDNNKKNDTIGLTVYNMEHLGYFWLPYSPAAVVQHWTKEDGKWIPAFFSKNTIEGIKAIKKLYDMGAIDKDFSIVKGDKALDKFVSGKAGALLWSACPAHMVKVQNKWEKVNTDKKFTDCIKIFKIWPAADGDRYHMVLTSYWSEIFLNSNIDDKKAERVLKLFDYMASEEGRMLLRYGIEGVDYQKNGDSIEILRNKGKAIYDTYPSLEALSSLISWDQDFCYELDNPNYDTEMLKICKENLDWNLKNTKSPVIDFRIDIMSTPAKDKLVYRDFDEATKIILSKDDTDKLWADLLKKYEEKGLLKAIEEVNIKVEELGIK